MPISLTTEIMQAKQLAAYTIAELHDYLEKLIPPNLPYSAKILDIGCGTGAWLERLANAGFYNLHGIDKDIQNFATQKASCSQVNLDIDDLGIGDQSFDLITCIEVVEHLENPGYLFNHVTHLLGANGYFLLTTPNLQSLICKLRFLLTGNLRQFDNKGDPTHIYPVFMPPLERILGNHNLGIVDKFTYPPNKSITSRASLKFVSSLLSLVMKDELPGDILCLLIQKS